MLKNKPGIFLIVTTAALIFVGLWLYKEIGHIESTRLHRASMKTTIHEQIKDQEPGTIVSSKLESRCGRAVYTLNIKDDNGAMRTLQYDIDNGLPIDADWIARCMRKP
ncbi:PepSY domain-containing protein [Thiolapillus sp.]